jgi:hypothetical protein
LKLFLFVVALKLFFLASSSGVAPISYNATFILWSGTILATEVGMKKFIPVNKILKTGNLTDYSQVTFLSKL